MRLISAIFAALLSLAALALPSATPAQSTPYLYIHNSSNNEVLVTTHVMIPALYEDQWAAPHKSVRFRPGAAAWKGILYISVRASTSATIDTKSPQVCHASTPIKGDGPRELTVMYDGHTCKLD